MGVEESGAPLSATPPSDVPPLSFTLPESWTLPASPASPDVLPEASVPPSWLPESPEPLPDPASLAVVAPPSSPVAVSAATVASLPPESFPGSGPAESCPGRLASSCGIPTDDELSPPHPEAQAPTYPAKAANAIVPTTDRLHFRDRNANILYLPHGNTARRAALANGSVASGDANESPPAGTTPTPEEHALFGARHRAILALGSAGR